MSDRGDGLRGAGFCAVPAAAACLLCGCLESAMSYSPDGKHLAMVVRHQVRDPGREVRGAAAYRLMILTERKTLRLLERTDRHMLSGPAYSPDGRRLCYLRVPLPTAAEAAKAQKAAEARVKHLAKLATDDADAWTLAMANPRDGVDWAAEKPLEVTDLTLPGVIATGQMLNDRVVAPLVRAELVVRDAAGGRILSTTPVRVPFSGNITDYHTTAVRYGPKGKWIFLAGAHTVRRVHPLLQQVHVLAAHGSVWGLSPDGGTLAVAAGEAIGLIATDGSRSVYVRCPPGSVLSSVAWAGNDRLAVLCIPDEDEEEDASPALHWFDKGGKRLKTIALPAADDEAPARVAGKLAASPDGKHLVATFGGDTCFLDRTGKVLGRVQGKKKMLLSPTFRPDSKIVAMKRVEVVDDRFVRPLDIAFFSPDGKELASKDIPPAETATTGPAK